MGRYTRVKICGITRVEDAIEASRLGADAIGLVFYEKSPRVVTVDQAEKICAALPPFVTPVGLFVNETPQSIKNIMSKLHLQLVQFHGDESPEYCDQFGFPYLKAIRMKEDLDAHVEINRFSTASGVLLDAYSTVARGGTGTVFDWKRVPLESGRPLILAGGLTPDNVAEAIMTAEPYAVDVSGGVEASPGIKDFKKMAAFMAAVHGDSQAQ